MVRAFHLLCATLPRANTTCASDGISSLKVLHDALDNLEAMTVNIQDAYQASLDGKAYDQPEDVDYSFEAVNDRLWEAKETAGLGSRAEFEEKKAAEAAAAALEREKLLKSKSIKVVKSRK